MQMQTSRRDARIVDLLGDGIIEKHETQELVLRPVHFVFRDDGYRSEPGCIAFDGIYRVYAYPVLLWRDWENSPAEYLHGVILGSGCDMKDMLRRAYEEKKPIRIGLHHVLDWTEYENIFADFSFYTPRTQEDEARLIEDWGRNRHERNTGEEGHRNE